MVNAVGKIHTARLNCDGGESDETNCGSGSPHFTKVSYGTMASQSMKALTKPFNN